MSHIFSIESSADGHLGYLCILMTVNNTAINTGVCASFQISIFISADIYRKVGLLDHMVALFLVFEGTSILFSTEAAPVYTPNNSVERFTFLHILVNTCYLWPFW